MPGYFIGTNHLTANLGTFNEPFDGSTRVKFDSIIHRHWMAGAVLNLMAGTYETWGSYDGNIASGVTIRGAGINATRVRVAADLPHRNLRLNVLGTGYGLISNVTISDLTIDGNYPGFAALNDTNRAMNGVALRGTGGFRITRVAFTNLIANAKTPSGPECEAAEITVGGGTAMNDCTNNLVTDCVLISPYYGTNQTDGVALLGIPPSTNQVSGVISNCIITSVHEGIGMGFVTGVTIAGNTISNCIDGIYGDTGNMTDLTVESNTFLRAWNCLADADNGGLVGVRANWTVMGNTATLNGSPNTPWGAFVLLRKNIRHVDMKIGYNSVDSVPGVSAVWLASAANITNTLWFSNRVEKRIRLTLNGSNNVVTNNVDWGGNPYP